jgi:hypothetical protein
MKPFDGPGFLERKTGRSRARYTKAYNAIQRCGLNLSRDSGISAFVKLERYYDEAKSPRMIMGRDPKFNILYAQIIEPIENAFFQLPQVANACDYEECGNKFAKLVGEWFMENDMSKYEASQRLLALQLEYMFYSKCMPENQDLIDKLFAWKIMKIGRTTTGLDFKFEQCRGSGDMDTSLGNGFLNYVSTTYNQIKNFCPQCELSSCAEPGCRTFKFVLKGDDSYSVIPVGAKVFNYYSDFGFDAKIIIRESPEDVEFCSGHFVEVTPGKWVYVQKLQKLIESLTTCINEDVIKNGWVSHYYQSLGLMYKTIYGNIPVYRDIADFLCESSRHGLNINLVNSYNLVDAFKAKHQNFEVDESLSMLSVSLVNKMDYAELQRISDWFKNHRLSFTPEMSKRCNLKSRKHTALPTIDFDQLNQVALSEVMTDRVYYYYKRLKTFRRRWVLRSA